METWGHVHETAKWIKFYPLILTESDAQNVTLKSWTPLRAQCPQLLHKARTSPNPMQCQIRSLQPQLVSKQPEQRAESPQAAQTQKLKVRHQGFDTTLINDKRLLIHPP